MVEREKLKELIEIVEGFGEARTAISSFDKALHNAGIGDYNLIQISSIIPRDFKINLTKCHNKKWATGTIVPVVMAKARGMAGEKISAGIAWALGPSGGMIVEGTSRNGIDLKKHLSISLDEMIKARKMQVIDRNFHVVTFKVKKQIGTVIVAAVYPPLKIF